MKLILCNSPPLHFTNTAKLPKTITLLNKNTTKCSNNNNNSNTLSTSLTAVALSLTLLISSPYPSNASLSPPPSPINPTNIENCREEDMVEEGDRESEVVVTNQGIVEEAWQIVYDSFLDASKHRWSPELWMQKEDILGSAIQSRAKAHDIIRRMLGSLGDPYTRFLTADEFSKMARYDITGIGINLREIPDESGNIKLKVLGLVLDGPAHNAGVRQGDEILAVNGMNVEGKSAFEVSSMLQGPNETSVTIRVKHGKCGPVQSLEVQRQLVARTPVFYRMEQTADGTTSIGYIRLKEFNALAKKDLVIAMKRLQDMGASYFILDLRDNLGGLVQAGIEIAKLFLNEGQKVIYTVGKDPQYQNTIVADSAAMITSPVVVLVNNRTASASEIVASALHDNCKAILVGEKTYGKGLIQSVYELQDGSGVVVTVGKYVTPNHMDINGNGLKPDFRNLPAWSDVAERLSKCNMSQQG